MRMVRKSISLLLIISLLFTTMLSPGMVKTKAETGVKEFSEDGYRLRITRQARWDTGYIARVEVENPNNRN